LNQNYSSFHVIAFRHIGYHPSPTRILLLLGPSQSTMDIQAKAADHALDTRNGYIDVTAVRTSKSSITLISAPQEQTFGGFIKLTRPRYHRELRRDGIYGLSVTIIQVLPPDMFPKPGVQLESPFPPGALSTGTICSVGWEIAFQRALVCLSLQLCAGLRCLLSSDLS
jgi:hypothetical protein